MATVMRAGNLKGRVYDKGNNTPLPYAIVSIENQAGLKRQAAADMDGQYEVKDLPDGPYRLSVSYMGYKKAQRNVNVRGITTADMALSPDALTLGEVVVTAREGKGITSSSIIDRKAIEHLQPSSFTDLLALLPGGSTSLPSLTSANSIHLRQAGTGGGNYDISSMGTMFVTDGIPINSNANMQQVRQASTGSYGDPDAGRNHTTTGVDMRTIPTDNIESVEIIRGIAPVEYGDLTSGLVLIQRKMKATPWEARFKADSYSKLLSLGKGVEQGTWVLNAGLDYLDAKADPRNALTNYKRLTGSLRLQKTWAIGGSSLRWRQNVDYTGSFDTDKQDPEVLKQKDDRYRSIYNRMSISQQLLWRPTANIPRDKSPATRIAVESVNLDMALAYENSHIDQDKEVSLSRDIAVSTSLQEGEHDGAYLPYHYLAKVTVDGQPLNAYAKLKSTISWKTGLLTQRINVGTEWKMDKNYGEGQVYDPNFPISPGTPYRPRNYCDIPAMHQLSGYVQDDAVWKLGQSQLTLAAGVRATQLGFSTTQNHAQKPVSITRHPYLDPRVNAQWRLPFISIGEKRLTIDINGGWGRQTKMPTLLQLFPDRAYKDVIELNYYHPDENLRRLYLHTYVIDPTNPHLRPARNDKWEVRLGSDYDGNTLSVTYFREQLSSGFRSTGVARTYSYRDFDESSIDSHQIVAPPQLTDIPFVEKTVLGIYGQTTNGSKLIKQGIEYQFSTKRFETLKTRLTMNGAWFKTTYTNSEPQFKSVTTAVIEGVPVNDIFLGYYDSSEGYVRQQLNTNVMADTYLPRLGLAFSVTAEMTWWYKTRMMHTNGVPIAYMDTTGDTHPYTVQDMEDMYRQWLVVKYNETSYVEQKTPFWAYLNLKVTKNFGRWMKLALFIDRMLDYMPDYTTVSGLKVRRTSKPYFGMEMNINI